ncbi:hypothetical protein H1R20_g7364, partial [Candolleomyces eurysporus]
MSTSSSPSKPSRFGRLGNAVRRSSSLLSVTRSKTPANDNESDTASIKSAKHTQKIDTSESTTNRARGGSVSSGVAGAGGLSMPTPIAESPMREQEATAAEHYQPLGPSPLAQPQPQTPPPETQQRAMGAAKADSDAGSVPEAISTPEGTSPVGYVPPPLIDSSVGNPGAFTDDPDSLPQPTIIRDPYADSTTLSALERSRSASRSQLDLAASGGVTAAGRIEAQPSVGTTITNTDDGSAGYGGQFFSGPMHPDFAAAVEENTGLAASAPPSAPPSAVSEGQGYGFSKKAAEAERAREREREEERESSLPAYEAMATHNVWAAPATTAGSSSAPMLASRAPPSEDPFSDPPTSRAPPMPQPQPAPAPAPAPVPQVMPVERHDSFPAVLPLPPFHTLPAPQPLHQAPSNSEYGRERGYDVDSEARPLLGNGTARQYGSGGLQTQNSNSNNGSSSGFDAWVPQATVGSAAAVGAAAGAAAYGRSPTTENGSPTVYRSSRGIGALLPPPRLHELGWLEYHLPDGSFYYVHPTKKITTDVNLRDEKVLSEVTVYLEDGDLNSTNYDAFFNQDSSIQPVVQGHRASSTAKGVPPPSVEIWLRDMSTPKTRRKRGAPAFVPLKCFVDHHSRSVIVDPTGPQGQGKGKGKLVKSLTSSSKKKGPEEDQLDMEYRYWSFMEAHPSHTILPLKAKSEANDVLTWAWTDVKSNQFHVPGTAPRRSFTRAILDLCIGCICLGIPYLFLERARSFGAGGGRIIDDESTGGGLLRTGVGSSAGPVFVVGACACLVAAIVLSASVTFLSLPGLDGFTRIAGLGAVLFACLSMAATLVAFFRVKYDMDQATAATAGPLGAGTAVGLEGLVSISVSFFPFLFSPTLSIVMVANGNPSQKRAVILSLPLVFLAYSVIAFIVGITLYSFRGGSLNDLSNAWASLWVPSDSPAAPSAAFTAPSSSSGEEMNVYTTLPPGVAPERTTGEYARWSFVGLVGVAAGVVAVAWVVARR